LHPPSFPKLHSSFIYILPILFLLFWVSFVPFVELYLLPSLCFLLSLDVLLLNPLPLSLQLPLLLYPFHLLLDLCLSLLDVLVEDHISSADSFLYLDKLQLQSRTHLVQPDRNLRILFLVLEILRKDDFRVREIVHFALARISS